MVVPYEDVPESMRNAHLAMDRRDLEVRRLRAMTRHKQERYVYALLCDVVSEMKRIVFELRRRQWNTKVNPVIDGITWSPYQFSFNSKDPAAFRPNFEWSGVQFWWNLEPSHPLQSNVNYDASGWVQWHHDIIQHLLAYEKAHRDDPLVCCCKEEGCPTENGWGCKGECGCVACAQSYSDFLSSE